ncbi:CoA transferase [Rhodococcus sp. BS-15]|uniref:CoA transferase n=1 Tax=Rhodococcus sp. BS-15 TaxID=1304954 RepID=UPI001F380962|nr:CoA transferase [Rhodococcus sp. BS-15]
MTTFLAATLPVATIAAESVGVLGAAIGRVRGVFGFRPFPGAQSSMSAMAPTASSERIAASFMGGTMLRIDGAPVHPFADLSGFFRASDGWVRTHANYAHHRTALLDAVGLDGDCDTERFAGRVAGITAAELEWSCSNSGALAVQVRTEDQWSAHPAGEAARSGPLIERTDAGAASLDRIPVFRGGTYAAPLAGVRVLDLTRVIAGPVATRALALFGADVLRIDPPQLPEIAWQHLENGQGKRSASVDLNTRAGLVRVQRLLDSADVLVTGYRPGALERFGLEHRGGVVHGRISAWGTRGPWSDRRGFDPRGPRRTRTVACPSPRPRKWVPPRRGDRLGVGRSRRRIRIERRGRGVPGPDSRMVDGAARPGSESWFGRDAVCRLRRDTRSCHDSPAGVRRVRRLPVSCTPMGNRRRRLDVTPSSRRVRSGQPAPTPRCTAPWLPRSNRPAAETLPMVA